MTNSELRLVFGGFRDLNLVFLATDLERGLVSNEAWIEYDGRLCPVAHGWVRKPERCDAGDGFIPNIVASMISTDHILLARQFIRKWDSGAITSNQLESVVKAMLDERRADLDAVQEILTSEPTCNAQPAEPRPDYSWLSAMV